MPAPASEACGNPLRSWLDTLPPARARLEQYLAHWAAATPDAEAAVDARGRLTFRQLAGQVSSTAQALERLGVQSGDCVAVLAPPSIDFLVSLLATWTRGATWVGLNPKYTREELRFLVRDAEPRVLLARRRISERDYASDLQDLEALMSRQRGAVHLFGSDALRCAPAGGRSSVAHFARDPAADPVQDSSPAQTAGETALWVYTSGTTGAPKAARLPHRALVRGASVRAHVWAVEPFRALNNLPISHIGCVGDIACTTLVAGGCQVFLERFSAVATLDLIARERISFWYQVPTMFQLCLDAAEAASTDWTSLQAAIWSGGRAPAALIERLRAVAPRVAVDYSMTESVGAITLSPLEARSTELHECVGWPDQGRTVRLIDPDSGEPAPRGSAGEVQLRDPWMFEGYAGGAQDASSFSPEGWFRTGDLAVERLDGTWQIVGRTKELFKSGGYNVYPREIELVLEAHPLVAGVAVAPAEDPLFGEVGVAFVVARDATLRPAELDAHCRSRLANYKVPKRFVIVAELPMLAIGKLDRQALRARAREVHRREAPT
jgi:acyl-CoA synthetase (AMP-forming)/AMP-acid ligase II